MLRLVSGEEKYSQVLGLPVRGKKDSKICVHGLFRNCECLGETIDFYNRFAPDNASIFWNIINIENQRPYFAQCFFDSWSRQINYIIRQVQKMRYCHPLSKFNRNSDSSMKAVYGIYLGIAMGN